MRRLLFGLLLLIGSIGPVSAQRMLPGQMGMDLNFGIMPDHQFGKSSYLNMGVTRNGRGGNYGFVALEYAYQLHQYRKGEIPVESYSGEVGYSLRMMGDASNSFNVNASILGLVGHESYNGGQAILYDGGLLLNKDGLIYGMGTRLSLETYLSDTIVVLLHGRLKVLKGTSISPVRLGTGIGLRFNF